MEYKILLSYEVDNKIKTIDTLDFNFENDDLILSVFNEYLSNGSHYSVLIKPKLSIKLLMFNLIKSYQYQDDEYYFINGYQSWTESYEYNKKEKVRNVNALPKWILKGYNLEQFGDGWFRDCPGKKGIFHGYTYAYIRKDDTYNLFASSNDFNAYTIFVFNTRNNMLTVESDIKGLKIDKEFKLLDFIEISGNEKKVFDDYKKFFAIKKPRVKPISGFSSWYNYYQNISEKIILENIDEIAKAGNKLFQIDDGYQPFIGDFLETNKEKFPHGMKFIASKIHEKGMKAGIWVAPFTAETKSSLVKKHPEWLVKDGNGKPIIVGCAWSKHYALDFYNKEVRAYIKKILKLMVVDYGFDFLKLDFLYAACAGFREDKTRAQVMREAMEFIKENSYDAEILGCGVQLVSAAGLVDYCRIGPDVNLLFDDKWYMRHIHRERISTKITLLNTISRRHIDKYWFLNDPDVYLLRDENMKMNRNQKYALGMLNHIFGSLYLTSDNLKYYDEDKLNMVKEMNEIKDFKYRNVKRIKNTYCFEVYNKEVTYDCVYHMNKGKLIINKK